MARASNAKDISRLRRTVIWASLGTFLLGFIGISLTTQSGTNTKLEPNRRLAVNQQEFFEWFREQQTIAEDRKKQFPFEDRQHAFNEVKHYYEKALAADDSHYKVRCGNHNAQRTLCKGFVREHKSTLSG